MDLRHVCHLVAEALKTTANSLLGDDAAAVHAHVASVGEDTGIVVLVVEHREYELTVRELNRRPIRPDNRTVP